MSKRRRGAIADMASHSGTLRLGDTTVAVHVLFSGQRVIEITEIEALIGLPPSGLGDFLATLPGTDRVRFMLKPDPRDPLAGRWRTGLPATKVVEMLNAFWIANNGTAAGAKAGRILRDVMIEGMRKAGVDPTGADFLMAAAMPPKERR